MLARKYCRVGAEASSAQRSEATRAFVLEDESIAARSELPGWISSVLPFRLQHFAFGFPLRLHVFLLCLLLFPVGFLGSARL
jgi:hypothetical protein